MPFTDEQPFLDAIFSRPTDDGPRLMYADFLEAAGDPERAELVRLQLALAHLPGEHPRRPELTDRQAGLLAEHSSRWTEHLRHLVAGVEFRRGVPDSVAVYAGTFLSDGDELFRRTRVRRLRLLEASGVMHRLIHSPLLANVRELDLCSNDLGNGGVNLLVRSPFLKELVSLDLGFNGLDDAGVRAVARAASLPALTALSLNDNGQITANGLQTLAHSPFFAGLTSLDVSGNDISDAGVQAVVVSKSLTRLHTLRLKGNHIGDAGVAMLARSPLLARLLARSSRLELGDNAIGPAGTAVLAASPALDCCTALDLSGNYLGDRGFTALLGSPHLSRLHTLKLARNQITDAGVGGVRDLLPGVVSRLRCLDLSGNRLTSYGVGIVQTARGTSRLVLDTSGNVQTSAGGEAPVTVGQVVSGVLQDVAEAAELRRRVSHPLWRPGDRPV